MDIKYLLHILLFVIILVGIYCITLHVYKRQYDFFSLILEEECSFIYCKFSKFIQKNKICAYDKYEIWRYIEHRKYLHL